jgi:hypothetical protein
MLSQKELEQWINRHRIYKIVCLVPDIAGNAQGVFVEVSSAVNLFNLSH